VALKSTKGEVKIALRTLCNFCRVIQENTGVVRERNFIRMRDWEKMHEKMPPLDHIPLSTSKFAKNVYNEVLEALSTHNIKVKAEFNYLHHNFYQKAPGSKEKGLRADLVVQIQREGREKPQTIVVEAQG
jgi:hypothetical protein